MTTLFDAYLKTKKDLDTTDLDPRFIPFFRTGARIKVNDYGDIRTGTVGITTGHKPVFLLVHSSRSMDSSVLLTPKTVILATKPRGQRKYHDYDHA